MAAAKVPVLRRHALAFAVFAALCVLWKVAVPVGHVLTLTVSVNTEVHDDRTGRDEVVAVTLHREVRRFGMPSGLVRIGTNTWTTAWPGPGGGEPPISLAAQAIARFRDIVPVAREPVGTFVAWSELGIYDVTNALSGFVMLCAWWAGVRQSIFRPRRDGILRTLVVFGYYPAWITGLGAFTLLPLWELLGRPMPAGPLLVNDEVVFVATMFFAAVVLVLVLSGRAPELQRGLEVEGSPGETASERDPLAPS